MSSQKLSFRFIGEVEKYMENCSKSQKRIIGVFIKFRNAPFIKLTNEYIAQISGCCSKTVIRATNKFHSDGFINKYQDNKFAPNYFSFNDSIKKQF